MTAVFFADEKQKKIAYDTFQKTQTDRKQRLTTFVLPLKEFYLAEGYHQKYMLRQRQDLMREFVQMYPSEADFMKSSAAARVNGYLGGHGAHAQLQEEIDGFGLSAQGKATLLNLVKLYGKK